jgi:hypothetical protein
MYGGVGDSTYWANPVCPAEFVSMACKYDALLQLSRLHEGEPRKQAIRSASRAWPGSLREAELAGPTVCGRRRASARRGLSQPAATRSAWRDREAAAVVLWLDLHRLLADQVAWKAHGGTGGCEAFIGSLSVSVATRWPDAQTLQSVAGAKVRPRQAYLWLAARAGLELALLNFTLFERDGHWDERADDPPWARIG